MIAREILEIESAGKLPVSSIRLCLKMELRKPFGMPPYADPV